MNIQVLTDFKLINSPPVFRRGNLHMPLGYVQIGLVNSRRTVFAPLRFKKIYATNPASTERSEFNETNEKT